MPRSSSSDVRFLATGVAGVIANPERVFELGDSGTLEAAARG